MTFSMISFNILMLICIKFVSVMAFCDTMCTNGPACCSSFHICALDYSECDCSLCKFNCCFNGRCGSKDECDSSTNTGLIIAMLSILCGLLCFSMLFYKCINVIKKRKQLANHNAMLLINNQNRNRNRTIITQHISHNLQIAGPQIISQSKPTILIYQVSVRGAPLEVSPASKIIDEIK